MCKWLSCMSLLVQHVKIQPNSYRHLWECQKRKISEWAFFLVGVHPANIISVTVQLFTFHTFLIGEWQPGGSWWARPNKSYLWPKAREPLFPLHWNLGLLDTLEPEGILMHIPIHGWAASLCTESPQDILGVRGELNLESLFCVIQALYTTWYACMDQLYL